jgi:hypothetical protein
MPTRCPNGTRRNKKNGLCEAKDKSNSRCAKGTRRNKATGRCESATKKQPRCPKGSRRNKITGLCESIIKNDQKFAHHVKFTVRYTADFTSKKELENWFKNGDSYSYIYPDPDDDELSNFKYTAERVKGRYGGYTHFVHIEFDTNKDQNYIINNILPTIEMNDADGNHPVNGELVQGDIIQDSMHIDNN